MSNFIFFFNCMTCFVFQAGNCVKCNLNILQKITNLIPTYQKL